MSILAIVPVVLNKILKQMPCRAPSAGSRSYSRGGKCLQIAPILLLVSLLDAPAFADTTGPWSSLVPKGFHVIETIRGDLNQDGQDDVVLLVKASDPADIVTDKSGERVDRNLRGLVIAFRDHDGYRLAVKNPTCFSSEHEDGGVYYAPELSVSVERGSLILHYSHGRYGYWRYTFRYQLGDFALIGYDRSEDHGPVVQTFTSINLSTGKKLKKVNINSQVPDADERFVEHWSRIVVPKPIRLSEIASFDGGAIEQALGEQ
jgi:hypothetical protein